MKEDLRAMGRVSLSAIFAGIVSGWLLSASGALAATFEGVRLGGASSYIFSARSEKNVRTVESGSEKSCSDLLSALGPLHSLALDTKTPAESKSRAGVLADSLSDTGGVPGYDTFITQLLHGHLEDARETAEAYWRNWIPQPASKTASGLIFSEAGLVIGLEFKSLHDLSEFIRNDGANVFREMRYSTLRLHMLEEMFDLVAARSHVLEFANVTSQLKDFTSLKTLDLSGNDIGMDRAESAEFLRGLTQLVQLRSLNISVKVATYLRPEDIESIASFKNLEHLQMAGWRYSNRGAPSQENDSIFTALAGLTHLQSLDVRDLENFLNPKRNRVLHLFNGLQELAVFHGFTNERIVTFPRLRRLSIFGNPKIDPSTLTALREMSDLESVCLGASADFFPPQLLAALSGLPKLTKLDLDLRHFSAGAHDTAHFAALSRFQFLTDLELRLNSHVREEEIQVISQLKSLKQLKLHYDQAEFSSGSSSSNTRKTRELIRRLVRQLWQRGVAVDFDY